MTPVILTIETALLPVILVTSLDAQAERVKGLEAGADDFLSKPVNWQELFARVRSLLRVKNLQDELKESARRVWLAGLGALAAAGEEGSKMFSRLVERGRDYEGKGRTTVNEQVNRATSAAEMAKAAVVPAARSAICSGGMTGPPSGLRKRPSAPLRAR